MEHVTDLAPVPTADLLAELARRARAGDPEASALLRPPLVTPMRRRRREMPRSGFGVAAWPNE